MARGNKPSEQKLQKLDVVVRRERDTLEVHLASLEALRWVERNVTVENRVIVTSLTWPTALAAEITQAMEADGLVVNRQDADDGLKVKILPNERGNPPGKLADANCISPMDRLRV